MENLQAEFACCWSGILASKRGLTSVIVEPDGSAWTQAFSERFVSEMVVLVSCSGGIISRGERERSNGGEAQN